MCIIIKKNTYTRKIIQHTFRKMVESYSACIKKPCLTIYHLLQTTKILDENGPNLWSSCSVCLLLYRCLLRQTMCLHRHQSEKINGFPLLRLLSMKRFGGVHPQFQCYSKLLLVQSKQIGSPELPYYSTKKLLKSNIP